MTIDEQVQPGTPPRDDSILAGDAVITAAPVAREDRIASLDFIRGIAVMGIVAANIIAFGQPMLAYMAPSSFLVDPAEPGGWQWIAQFVLIDGKMRGLFTVLFGAGMYLFMERAWARGSTRWLQVWRLVVLFGFGLIHYFFIWFGDILAMYAMIGCLALACIHWKPATQMCVGLFGFIFGGILFGGSLTLMWLVADTSFGTTEALADIRNGMIDGTKDMVASDIADTARIKSGDYGAVVQNRIANEWSSPFTNSIFLVFETLPLMLIGMALYRTGFFSGAYDSARMRRWGWIGLVAGGLVHLGIGLLVREYSFSIYAGYAAFVGWSVLPRLAMILGMAALLVEYSRDATGWLGRRISAAGRAAFTNYLGTSILMMIVFQGWGLGLFGELNRPQLYLVCVGVWIVMLAWSQPWLERFRYGPLEWLWRCLTYRRVFPVRR